ncbi:LysR family transcriptional regulator [Dongia sp.]|uniref:LysR family transcriptional regulator n=1 Tax=Dongia sp. TaxID=1977262 RepID=UPI0035B0AFF6
MQNLNDLFYFAQVVEQGGFAAAGRALGIPKSKLSRRIAELERKLDTRLLQRSTRKLALTQMGEVYLKHCQAMIAEAQAAQEAIERAHAEPQGLVRLSCPTAMTQAVLSPVIPKFLTRYPKVRLAILSTNRRVDVIREGLDIALRVRQPPLDDSNLIVHRFGAKSAVMVAAPTLLDRLGRPKSVEDLARFPTLTHAPEEGRQFWQLLSPDGETEQVEVQPRLMIDDFETLKTAAVAGIGISLIPEYFCRAEINSGLLEVILPDHAPPIGDFHAVFTSRRGQLPAVRAFLDFLDAEILVLARQCVGGLEPIETAATPDMPPRRKGGRVI